VTSVKAWFPTLIYCERLQTRGLRAFNLELLDECYRIRDYDEPGRAWSASNYPPGYTSYGSLDQLHRFSSTFDTLRARIDAHVTAYAHELDWDLRGGRLAMSDCWLSIMPRGCAHSFHVHPQAVVSGTYYVATPPGCAGLKFEDPRMTNFMAAPARKRRGRADQRAHISYPARVGNVILFESWLRHEVPPSQIDEDRISISFNYHWN
jgi:uncharacterized protein (TIGR02466 family)